MDGSALIDLKVGGKTRPVIVKDQQLHPVRDEVMHIDLLEVRLDEKIQTPVGVHIEGGEEAPGVKEGGVLEQVTHQLNIEALPTAIPDYITVDVSGMEIAATMHLSELTAPEGVEFLDDPEETIIATVVVPTEVEEPERSRRRPSWSARTASRSRRGRAGRGRDRRGGRAEGWRGRRGGRGLRVSLFRRGMAGQGSTGWSWGSGIRATATPAPATTSASRWPKLAAERWGLPKFKQKYGGLYTDGRPGPAARVAVLLPQTYMNESGNSAGPARGALGVDLDHVVAVHDEIDLPFGRSRSGSAAGSPGTTASSR